MINHRRLKEQYQATYHRKEGVIVVTLFADTVREARRFIKSLFGLEKLDDVEIFLVRSAALNDNGELQLDEYS